MYDSVKRFEPTITGGAASAASAVESMTSKAAKPIRILCIGPFWQASTEATAGARVGRVPQTIGKSWV